MSDPNFQDRVSDVKREAATNTKTYETNALKSILKQQAPNNRKYYQEEEKKQEESKGQPAKQETCDEWEEDWDSDDEEHR